MYKRQEGASSLCVNGSVDMLGRLAGISASKYTGYPPYDDAPKEGESVSYTHLDVYKRQVEFILFLVCLVRSSMYAKFAISICFGLVIRLKFVG